MLKKQIYHIILLGPQGSGKGTQAKLLAEKFNLELIETGRAFREIAESKTALGKKVAQRINNGRLVSSPVVIEIVKNKLKHIPVHKGIIFDGVPRLMFQVVLLKRVLVEYSRKITYVFFVRISEKETIERLSKRRGCQECGAIFISGKDIAVGTTECPKCGGRVVQREDDRPKAIKQRLEIFNCGTMPIVEYYEKRGKLIEIDGEQSIQKVFKDILSYL